MYNFLTKRGQMVAFLLGAIVTLIFLGSAVGGLEEFSALGVDAQKQTSIFDFGLYAGIGLAALCLIIAIIFGIFQVISNPKGSLKGLIGLAVLAAIFFALYSTSKADFGLDTKLGELMQTNNLSAGAFKGISGGILLGVALLAGAFVIMILAELRNAFK